MRRRVTKREIVRALSRPRASKHWKQVEREVAGYLGGKRTPLSGSNSQHNTSSDVIGCPLWMYVEVKWDKTYDKFFTLYYDNLAANLILQFNYYGLPLYVFRFDTWYKKWGASPNSISGNAIKGTQHSNIKHGMSPSWQPDLIYTLDSPNRVFNLYTQDTIPKCAKEGALGRKCSFQFHRMHGRRGLYCVTDQAGYKRLLEWRRQSGHGRIEDQKIKPEEALKIRLERETKKRARLLSRALPLSEERSFPNIRKDLPEDQDGIGVR